MDAKFTTRGAPITRMLEERKPEGIVEVMLNDLRRVRQRRPVRRGRGGEGVLGGHAYFYDYLVKKARGHAPAGNAQTPQSRINFPCGRGPIVGRRS